MDGGPSDNIREILRRERDFFLSNNNHQALDSRGLRPRDSVANFNLSPLSSPTLPTPSQERKKSNASEGSNKRDSKVLTAPKSEGESSNGANSKENSEDENEEEFFSSDEETDDNAKDEGEEEIKPRKEAKKEEEADGEKRRTASITSKRRTLEPSDIDLSLSPRSSGQDKVANNDNSISRDFREGESPDRSTVEFEHKPIKLFMGNNISRNAWDDDEAAPIVHERPPPGVLDIIKLFIFEWRIPLIRWPLFPFIVFFAVLIPVAVTKGRYIQLDKVGDDIYLFEMLMWCCFVVGTALVIHFLCHCIIWLIKAQFPFTKASYFVSKSVYPYTFAIWGAINLAIWRQFMNPLVNDDANFWADALIQTILIIGVTRCILGFGKKYILSHIQQKEYWKEILDNVYKEKVISTLLNPPRQRRIYAAEAGQDNQAQFKKGWKYLKQANPKKKREMAKQKLLNRASELAHRIFRNVGTDFEKTMHNQVLEPFFESQKEIKRVYGIFHLNYEEPITLDDLTISLYDIFVEQISLFNAIHDRRDVLKILYLVVEVIFWCILGIFILVVFGIDLTDYFMPAATFTITLSFIFGDSIKTCWESTLFIFVMKPFEIGDRFTVADSIGGKFPTLVVTRITLLATYCFAVDGPQYILPNASLYRSSIRSYKNSRDHAITLNINVALKTTRKQIEEMNRRILKWLYEDDSAPWKASEAAFWASHVDKFGMMVLNVWVELKGVSWQKSSMFSGPRNNLILAIHQICQDLNIDRRPAEPGEGDDE
eukprot:TRINITY_DN495_c0_g1_i1.p1 TRINITY_DN495_c0_g1~~TRINITY_DN495_c0_g1_i1.p1  ORF type:complete len:769 (-),score=272.18 TRINITY_DN495_c0_g1_i1:339-2645(-)